jgi:glutamate dehydrogenase
MKNMKDFSFYEGHESALRKMNGLVMVSKLIDCPSTVHRRVSMDAISVKVFGKDGLVTGVQLFVGLFTSSTYSCRTGEVPIVRRKVRETIARAGFRTGSHDHKALEHILEKMPRDELFQASADEVYALSLGILRLQTRRGIALFTHQDPMQQYMSCLVYIPRDRYNTNFVLQAGKVLESAVSGRLVNYFTTLDDSPLARALFTVRLESGKGKSFDASAAEQKLIELGREWDERLRHALVESYGRIKGAELSALYGRAFPSAYSEAMEISNALHDIRHLEALDENQENIRIDLYNPGDVADQARLKVYNRGAPVALCDIMPVLENMGLRGLSENPYQVRPAGKDTVWIHDFHLAGAGETNFSEIKKDFEEAFLQIWQGHIENDRFNQLVLCAGLGWEEARLFRAYSGFMRQARFPHTGNYVAQVLSDYPRIAREIALLFDALHNPAGGGNAVKINSKIDEMLQGVPTLDHDRILRAFRMLVEKTLRTNYYQEDKQALAFKFDSSNIDGLPLPRPHVEIFVYSPRVEAVHLRNGEIARGGIRWSDRPDDFRTEVLGLVKAQTVKNTVIVPTGAKGGFVVKQPPKTGGRSAYQEEGIACYKIFVQTLLDLTDNNVHGKIVRPKNVVCHDDADPYLVVAADKGTAKFSDIANALSLKAGFWLGDAFASGGSAGYDHKGMGITARGGWESVKRHFRVLGKDIQKELFTVIGVGDMGGDVFGNAMLLSRQIQLVAAFNHLHIFCDPEPDSRTSYAERKRLFKGVLGWDAYDKSKLSAGGEIYDRHAKSIKLSPQIKKRFGIAQDTVAPDDLVKAILTAEAELLWFGGIGTFIKGAKQSHADADDKANDSVRVDGTDIRARVIGEGANMGITQLGRVEYARAGGRINTDFIDNSAGVDCSDHEVNIKILFADVMARGKISLPQRNKFLESMTDDVAALVLQDNYQQTQSLALQAFTARATLSRHGDLIRALEKENLIRRQLEGLPDEETLSRLAREGQGLVSPELCVLTSWAKIALYKEVIASTIPDDPALEWMLFGYFPAALKSYETEIRAHKLKREIIATQVVNILVNRMGPVFVQSRMEKTGASAVETVRAFIVVMEAFGLREIWASIEALDDQVAGAVQVAAQEEVFQVCKRAVTWLLRFGPDSLNIGRDIAAFKPGIALVRKNVTRFLPPESIAALRETEGRLRARGVPSEIALHLSVMNLLSSACDIVTIARKTKKDIGAVATAYFLTGQRLPIDWIMKELPRLEPLDGWQARVIGGVLDDCYIYQAAVASLLVKAQDKSKNWPESWFEKNRAALNRVEQTVAEMRAQPKMDLDMLVLATQRIGQFLISLES